MKSIVFLNYRAGSVLFESMCGKEWRILIAQGKPQEAIDYVNSHRNEPFFLPTVPPVLSEDISVDIKKTIDPYVYITHVGDWWGQLASKDIPGPYDIQTPASWSFADLINLGLGWKFAYIMRDGRNQIESLRNFKGGIEEELQTRDPIDYFKALCKGFRNRARIALDCQRAIPNVYKIFRAEDLFENPLDTMTDIFQFLGYNLDVNQVQSFLNRIPQGQIHSSFDSAKYNNRWYTWTQKERDIFNDIASRELKELGYV